MFAVGSRRRSTRASAGCCCCSAAGPALALGARFSTPAAPRTSGARARRTARSPRGSRRALAGHPRDQGLRRRGGRAAALRGGARAAFDAAFDARSLLRASRSSLFWVRRVGPAGGGRRLGRASQPRARHGARGRLFAATGVSGLEPRLFQYSKRPLRRRHQLSCAGCSAPGARAQDIAVGLDRVFELLDLEPEVQDAPDALPLAAVRARHRVRRASSFRYQRRPPGARAASSFEARRSARSRRSSARPARARARCWRCCCGSSIRTRAASRSTASTCAGSASRACARTSRSRCRRTCCSAPRSARTSATRCRTPSDAAVREAARVACADEFIEKLPRGYDTPLGERGTKLSTGQRQRLSIARAVLKDAPILVLDEPTASLDAETEHARARAISRPGAAAARSSWSRTGSRRSATPTRSSCSTHGRVVESGTHDELLARRGGAYRALVASERDRPRASAVSAAPSRRPIGARDAAAVRRALRYVAPFRARFAVKLGLTARQRCCRCCCCPGRSRS